MSIFFCPFLILRKILYLIHPHISWQVRIPHIFYLHPIDTPTWKWRNVPDCKIRKDFGGFIRYICPLSRKGI